MSITDGFNVGEFEEDYCNFILCSCILLARENEDEEPSKTREKASRIFDSLANGIQGNRSDETNIDEASMNLLLEKIITRLHEKFVLKQKTAI